MNQKSRKIKTNEWDSGCDDDIPVARATYTIPKDECEFIEALRRRLGKQGEVFNRSEVIRAGILALTGMSDKNLLAATKKVRRLKPGRQK